MITVSRVGSRSRLARILFGSAAIGFLSGLLVPSWAVDYQAPTLVLGVVIIMLTTALVGLTFVVAAHSSLVIGGAVALINVIVMAVIFFVSWFTVGPSGIVAIWLCVVGITIAGRPEGRGRPVLVAGVVVGALSLAASTEILTRAGFPAISSGIALNGCATVYLAVLTVRGRSLSTHKP